MTLGFENDSQELKVLAAQYSTGSISLSEYGDSLNKVGRPINLEAVGAYLGRRGFQRQILAFVDVGKSFANGFIRLLR